MRDAESVTAEELGKELKFVELGVDEVVELLPPFLNELFRYLRSMA